MSEVGALIVRLQAETAQFREDMGKVKGDLDSLKDKSGEAGAGISSSMGEARGGLMLVEDAVGVRLPRHLNALIAQIPGVGQVFAVMLPIAGIAVAIKIVGELIAKHREMAQEADKLESAERNLQGTIGSVFTSLNDKLLQAGIAADELAGNHLAAVKKELEIIDNQSLAELEKTFEELAGSAEKSLSLIKAHMFEVGSGGEGARASLARFQSQYEMLLKTGKAEQANKLLNDKITREEAILKLQEDAASKEGTGLDQMNRRIAAVKALHDITGQVVDFDDKTIESERDLLDILHAQSDARDVILKTASKKKDNASEKGNLQGLSEEAAFEKVVAAGIEQHSQALIKLARTKAETVMATTKDGEDDDIDSKLAKQKAAINEERQDAIDAADATHKAKNDANLADLKAAGNNEAKKRELTEQWKNTVKANADAVVQINADADKRIIEVDRAANNERLAIARSFHNSVASGIQQYAENAAKIQLKADEQASKNRRALGKQTEAQELQANLEFNKRAIQIELDGFNTQLKNLDKFDKNYLARVIELENKKKQAVQKGSADEASIRVAAAQKEATEIKAAEDKMRDAIASNIANSIVMNKNLAESFRQTGAQMAEQLIKNLIMMELTGEKEKLIHAKNAYHKAFDAMSGIPPAPVWGIAAGAAAFAAVMSFEEGGKIPGASVGSAGAVPIIGHQGETVVTKALTDRVERSEAYGSGKSGNHTWNYSPQVHAMDAEGVDRVLAKHSTIFQRHMSNTLRKLNR